MHTRGAEADKRESVRTMRAMMCGVGPVQKERREQRERGLRGAGSAARRLIEHAGLAGGLAGLSAARACCRGVGPSSTVHWAGSGCGTRAVGAHVERAASRQRRLGRVNWWLINGGQKLQVSSLRVKLDESTGWVGVWVPKGHLIKQKNGARTKSKNPNSAAPRFSRLYPPCSSVRPS